MSTCGGKSWQLIFWCFSWGGEKCAWTFFCEGSSIDQQLWQLSQIFSDDALLIRRPVATLNRNAFTFSLTSSNKLHGYGGMVFHHLVKLPLLVVFCQKLHLHPMLQGRIWSLQHNIYTYTPPKTITAPAKWWLEGNFPFQRVPFLGDMLILLGMLHVCTKYSYLGHHPLERHVWQMYTPEN